MESTGVLKTAGREEALVEWLRHACRSKDIVLQPIPGDASFRRYFRLYTETGPFIVMDAPPSHEDCRPFVAIAKALRATGLHAPAILHENLEAGFLLMTDFGDLTYLQSLQAGNADELYQRALRALAVLQRIRSVPGRTIPLFTPDFMRKEWEWHKEWFLQKLLGLSLTDNEKELDTCYDLLVASASAQPQVFMHRDYHSANLMVLPDQQVGILDFQDAFIGPVTYDVVSLLRDCYIDWPPEQVRHWASAYWQMLQAEEAFRDTDSETFLRWFDLMGIQRHLKALLTFARKHVRDHQPQYLRHVPRTLNYLLQVSARYPELAVLHDYLTASVEPAFLNKKVSLCVP
ncbi:aminoglycoside phosphotransferase family protein [Aquicella lusitana]|uniref:Aminoglycoside phosphotransferase domain-containing protein n=1 Tax=Aquicella lusitana TaxID=254246 RepID=A0A370GEF6_9COXI|nr:phosphotransferase [Aquicella lusitana]RDI41489.1 hypothetical protein C8D86_1197 [Aquicella lusitana]VVC72617.1 hypothetical protein AQULUS_03300 [Aquicella lusitana]